MQIITKSPAQTRIVGKMLAEEILKARGGRNSFLLALKGDLGGGKTTFLQGFAKGLDVKQKITSPTFVILKKFQIPNPKCQITNYKYFYHIDCYRIQKAKEILDLGFKEIVDNSQNVVAVEWAEKIQKLLPRDVFLIKFEFIGKNTRNINLAIKNGS